MTKIIDPWGSELAEDYGKIMKDFGLEEFNPKHFPDANKSMRRGDVFAGRDLKRISDCIKNKRRYSGRSQKKGFGISYSSIYCPWPRSKKNNLLFSVRKQAGSSFGL